MRLFSCTLFYFLIEYFKFIEGDFMADILDVNDIRISIVDNKNYKAIPILSIEEERELFRLYISGDKEVSKRAHDKIFYSNLRLVSRIALKYSSKDKDSYEDLFMEGCEGLLRAISKFDVSVGNRFSTCASYWILQRIRAYINDESKCIRIPAKFNHKIKIYIQSKYEYYNSFHDTSFVNYVIQNTFLTMEDIILIERTINGIVSLDDNIDSDIDIPLCEVICDDINVEDIVYDRIISKLSDNYVDDVLCNYNISERDRNIFYYKFGFMGYSLKKVEDLGAKYGVSHQRITQIIKRIIDKIKDDQEFVGNIREYSKRMSRK